MTLRIGVLVVGTSLLALAASAQEAANYRCVNGDHVRRIEVAYPTGGRAPCEVRYHKDTEAPGQAETPWRADNQAGDCEERAAELVDRLRGYGWACAAAAVTDDTDALAAGGDAEP